MEVGVDYTIRELLADDRLNSFRTGSAEFKPLKSFLRNQALDFHNSSIAKTYVAIKGAMDVNGTFIESEGVGILGYLTLTCSEIDARDGYTVEDCPYANQYESLPAVKVARLAIDERYRRQGIGDELIGLAIAIATDVIAPAIGCRFLVTDAKQSAVSFYDRSGFTLLDTQANRESDNPVMFIDLLLLNQ